MCDEDQSWESFSWQAQYLVMLEGDSCYSAYCTWRFMCGEDQSWGSCLVAGALFGGLGKFLSDFGMIGPLALRPCALLRAWGFCHVCYVLRSPLRPLARPCIFDASISCSKILSAPKTWLKGRVFLQTPIWWSSTVTFCGGALFGRISCADGLMLGSFSDRGRIMVAHCKWRFSHACKSRSYFGMLFSWRTIWWCWRVTPDAPRIVPDV